MADRFHVSAIICGVLACAIGLAYLVVAGAPNNMIIVNAAALSIGLLLAFSITRFAWFTHGPIMILSIVGSLCLLATAVLGYAIEGASRWVLVGPFFVQTSLILLPAMALSFARVQNLWTALAIVIAGLAMAMQPDRAMAAMLGLAVVVVSVKKPNLLTVTTSIFCVAAFCLTVFLPDRLPAVPYVDHILWTSFELNFITGLSLWTGCLLMICPIFFVPESERTVVHYTFVSCWFALIAAAAMGAYPTPLVGYGSSAIIGYFLSLSLIGPQMQIAKIENRASKDSLDIEGHDSMFRARPV